MRFTTAWAAVMSQNVALRAGLFSLSICASVLGFSVVRLALKPPLIIERACVSNATIPANAKHTASEIENFIRMALQKRFNSNAGDSRTFLSSEENVFRGKEQDELTRRSMTQTLLINGLRPTGSSVTVDTDRLIAIGKIKTVLPFPLLVTLGTIDRTAENPYGLIIQKVAQLHAEEASK